MIKELHTMGTLIGLKRYWFQPHKWHPHYDITAPQRAMAISLGAKFVPALEQARMSRKKA